jgi:hypothetical protein
MRKPKPGGKFKRDNNGLAGGMAGEILRLVRRGGATQRTLGFRICAATSVFVYTSPGGEAGFSQITSTTLID